MNVAEITHFNKNARFKFSKFGKICYEMRVPAIFLKFLKDHRFIVKNF